MDIIEHRDFNDTLFRADPRNIVRTKPERFVVGYIHPVLQYLALKHRSDMQPKAVSKNIVLASADATDKYHPSSTITAESALMPRFENMKVSLANVEEGQEEEILMSAFIKNPKGVTVADVLTAIVEQLTGGGGATEESLSQHSWELTFTGDGQDECGWMWLALNKEERARRCCFSFQRTYQ